MLVPSLFSISIWLSVPLRLSLFFRAVYRLLLYSVSQIGGLCEFMNFFRLSSINGPLNIFFHLVPVFLIFLKRGYIIGWVV